MLAMLLAQEAVSVEQNHETLSQLHATLAARPELLRIEGENSVGHAEFSPGGDTLLVASGRGLLALRVDAVLLLEGELIL